MIVDGETGVLVPPRDVTALTAALEWVARAPGNMGPAARRHCLPRFSLEVVTPCWEQLFEEVAAGAGAGDTSASAGGSLR